LLGLEVEELSIILSRIVGVGLRSVRAIQSGLPISQFVRVGDLALLEAATLPSAELEISVVAAIQSLFSATLAME
jgi:ribosomal protein S13